MKDTFNPKEWLAVPGNPKIEEETKREIPFLVSDDDKIETMVSKIEETGIDITADYTQWRNIGFALSEKFGESGRDYFHRVSRNYSDYNAKECDEQFTNCLNAKGHGISIASFYHYAHQAGIRIEKQYPESETSVKDENTPEVMPTFFR
jgi:hypothetical protein